VLREEGADAKRRSKAASGDDRVFQEGRALAYVEVLARMQTDADAFSLPKEELLLAGFDPVNDPLDPPASRRRES
jgi:hypothetical protein